MDNDNVVDDTIMDLDLNQEPVEPSRGQVGGLGILLDELETAHDQIEERIHRLEAVTARARQRQRWRLLHNRYLETSNSLSETISTAPNEVKCGKRDSSHLGALRLDTDGDKVINECGGFFDCNICLDMAREPILTCCGHLFCWACFFRLPYVYSVARECPVCKGEVTDASITPIYGNGKSASLAESDHGLIVPPRPQAHRVESLRQRRVNRAASHVPVSEALRRIRMGLSGEDRAQLQRDGGNTSELGGRWRLRTHQFSSVLPDSASSLYSISSALDNAERLVDDLESFVNGRFPGNSHTLDSNASSSQIPTEGIAPLATAEALPSSSSRIRIHFPEVETDPNYVLFRELRRRRLG